MGDRLRSLLGKPSAGNGDQKSSLLGKHSSGNGDHKSLPSSLLPTDEAISSTMSSWASNTSLAASDSHGHQSPKQSPSRPKIPSRGSALWPLGRGGATSLPDGPTTPSTDPVLEFMRRNPGPSPEAPKPKEFDPIAEIWHNPSLMQVGEALHAAMMSAKDPLAPIPKE